jgi:putative endonuclease
MKDERKTVGKVGEKEAAGYLQGKGYEIMSHNFYCKGGEIDIVAKKENKVIFCEVRTKISEKQGRPSESFTFFKKKHFSQAIRWYLRKNDLRQYKLSADFISVILYQNQKLKEIIHYENVMQPV